MEEDGQYRAPVQRSDDLLRLVRSRVFTTESTERLLITFGDLLIRAIGATEFFAYEEREDENGRQVIVKTHAVMAKKSSIHRVGEACQQRLKEFLISMKRSPANYGCCSFLSESRDQVKCLWLLPKPTFCSFEYQKWFVAMVEQQWVAIDKVQMARAMAAKDELTGLLNRRYLRGALENAMAKSRGQQLSFSLLFVDLDNFKYVNDSCGHIAGNLLLAEVADTLVKTLRSADIIVRYGGDEFVILLNEASRFMAEIVKDRIQCVFAQKRFSVGKFSWKQNVSIGCATYPDDALTAQELLRKADQAMYQEKSRISSLNLADSASTHPCF